MTIPEAPNSINSVIVNLNLSPKIVNSLRSEALATAIELNGREDVEPDVTSEEYAVPASRHGMPLGMRTLLGHAPTAIDFRIADRTDYPEPHVIINFRENNSRRLAESLDQPTVTGWGRYFEITQPSRQSQEGSIMPFSDLAIALDGLIPNANGAFTELVNPRHGFNFSKIAHATGRVMLHMSNRNSTEVSYHGKDILISDSTGILRAALPEMPEEPSSHMQLFAVQSGARLLLKTIVDGESDMPSESLQLSMIAPFEISKGTVHKEFHYFFPMHKGGGKGLLRLASRDLTTAQLKRFARESYRSDNQARPAKAALELVQENHLNSFQKTYAPNQNPDR